MLQYFLAGSASQFLKRLLDANINDVEPCMFGNAKVKKVFIKKDPLAEDLSTP